jgi:hypothetical protein
MNECYTPKRVHTDKVPTYVSTEYLLRELPGFDWTDGISGVGRCVIVILGSSREF